MTYFSQQPKKLDHLKNNSSKLGPGSYTPQHKHTNKYSYAPFGSLSRKNVVVKSQHNKNNIGPGTYQIQSQLVKPSISKYQNQKCVIIKINNDGGSQFKSKIPRFTSNKNQGTPGPGQYSSQINTPLNKKKRARSMGAVATKMRQLFTEQYTKRRIPTLHSDPILIEQNQNKQSGFKSKGIVKWHLNNKQRFKTEPKEMMRTEDQTQIIERINRQKKKSKNNQRYSSFFASCSTKSHFDQIIYKTNNPIKIQIRKMMGYDDQAPGPGSYNIHHQKQLKKKPIKHQFFGSTVQRFQTDFSETNDVGPGEYYSSQKLKKNNSRNKLRKPSQYRKKASQQQDESFEASNVGPGSYNHHNFKVNTYNTKLLNGNGAFGSHNPRFQTQKRQQQVMTKSKIDFMASQDKQRKQRIEQALNMRKKVLQNKPHSIFNSETKRNCFQDCAYRQNVPFGAYEVNNEDISTKLQKKKQYEKQIAECNLKRPGFMSTVQRFQGHKQQKSQHKDCWCLIRQVEKRSIQHQSAVFESKSKRTQIFEQKNTGPAVGEYSKNSDFVKQSFNSRFIKQNQNKSKKMKMWKKTKQ